MSRDFTQGVDESVVRWNPQKRASDWAALGHNWATFRTTIGRESLFLR
jgi:hypothetical protein